MIKKQKHHRIMNPKQLIVLVEWGSDCEGASKTIYGTKETLRFTG